MALLTKEQISNISDRPIETISVPEWGGEVRIKCFSGQERDELEESLLKERKEGETPNLINHRARVVTLAIVHPDRDEKMFGLDEIKILAEKSSVALQRVYKAAIKLSKMRKEDIEEAEKN
jgi:hypothetical protein